MRFLFGSAFLDLDRFKVLEYLLNPLPEARLLIMEPRRFLRVTPGLIKLLLKFPDALLMRTALGHERIYSSLDFSKSFFKILQIVFSSSLLRNRKSPGPRQIAL